MVTPPTLKQLGLSLPNHLGVAPPSSPKIAVCGTYWRDYGSVDSIGQLPQVWVCNPLTMALDMASAIHCPFATRADTTPPARYFKGWNNFAPDWPTKPFALPSDRVPLCKTSAIGKIGSCPPCIALSDTHHAEAPPHKHVPAKAGMRKPLHSQR